MSRVAAIVSDGTPRGTKLFDNNGEQITDVIAITWHSELHEPHAQCTVTFRDVAIDVTVPDSGDDDG